MTPSLGPKSEVNFWLREFDKESWAEIEKDNKTFRKENYDWEYLDAHKLCENLLWNIDVPIISVINGDSLSKLKFSKSSRLLI